MAKDYTITILCSTFNGKISSIMNRSYPGQLGGVVCVCVCVCVCVLAVLEPSESASRELAFIRVITGFRNLNFHGCLLLGCFFTFLSAHI